MLHTLEQFLKFCCHCGRKYRAGEQVEAIPLQREDGQTFIVPVCSECEKRSMPHA